MQCPACSNTMTQRTAGDIAVEVCDGGCGGIWFDNHELRRLDEAHESAGEELLDVRRDPGVRPDHSELRNCPKCDDVLMFRHFWSVARDVEIDECQMCGGVWLDDGELGSIRSKYDTEEERKKAAADHFEAMFGEQLAERRAESQEKLEKARSVARALKFITPSYWIPGKQEGGAF